MALHAPTRSLAPFVALAAGSLALDAAPHVPWAAGVAGAGLFAAAGAVRRAQIAAERRGARRVADDRILRGHGVPVWREEELVSARARRAKRREVNGILRSAAPDRLPGASPLNRVAVRDCAALLRSLAERLDDEGPVSAYGMLHLKQLLSDPSSPLYGEHDELLPRAIARVVRALDE
jgi:hypothetical protein